MTSPSRLSSEGLLRYLGWNGSDGEYIRSFDGGPLRQITQEYGEDMATARGRSI